MLVVAWTLPAHGEPGSLVGEQAEPSAARLEVGVGIGVLSRADYPGARDVTTTALPVPYASYESEKLDLTREGLTAKLLRSENIRLGLSVSAFLPGDASQDTVRRGMPKLLPTFEIGPLLDWHVAGSAAGEWHLQLPVRAVAASDFKHFEDIGWVANPQLYFESLLTRGRWEIETGVGVGPKWASPEYNRYFYRVRSQYATPDRPTYDTGGGYSGLGTTVFLGLRHGRWGFALGIAHNQLEGAVFRDSPLVETKSSTSVAAGLFYSLWVREFTAERSGH